MLPTAYKLKKALMMENDRANVSVLEPLGPAIEHVKTLLFRPFNLDRWLAIGFCAWLAQLGSGPGGHGGGDNKHPLNPEGIRQTWEQTLNYIHTNATWLIPTLYVAVALGIVLWIVLTWLSSRGRFMILYNVTYNTAEVKRPWAMFREYGHSLFLFRMALDIIAGVLFLGLVGLGVAIMLSTWTALGLKILWNLLWLVPALIVLAGVVGLIKLFTTDFVVPLMLKRTTYCVPAWQEFKGLLSHNQGRFMLYALFKGLIGLAMGLLIFFVGFLTCCCGFILLIIPFVGTVVLLPLHVFYRAYSLHYLRQYGPAYDLLITPTA